MLQFLLFSTFSGRPPEHPPAAQSPCAAIGAAAPASAAAAAPARPRLLSAARGRPRPPGPRQCRRVGSGARRCGGGRGPAGSAGPHPSLRRRLPAGAGTCAVPAPRSAAALRPLRRLPRPSRRAEEGEGERGRRRRVGREKERRGERRETRRNLLPLLPALPGRAAARPLPGPCGLRSAGGGIQGRGAPRGRRLPVSWGRCAKLPCLCSGGAGAVAAGAGGGAAAGLPVPGRGPRCGRALLRAVTGAGHGPGGVSCADLRGAGLPRLPAPAAASQPRSRISIEILLRSDRLQFVSQRHLLFGLESRQEERVAGASGGCSSNGAAGADCP